MEINMKKALSLILSLAVMLMTSLTAFAAEKPSIDTVNAQIEGAVSYLSNGVTYDVNNAVDFASIAESGVDLSSFKDNFVASVKENLEANNGKIVSSYGESLEGYAAVIISLQALGEDTTDFYGYNIEGAFLAMDPTADPASPNYYRLITKAALYCENGESFLEQVCDSYIDKYYTMGKGADYWGFSCDNTAYFIDAVANGYAVSDKYEAVLDDAIKVLDTYKTDGGYYYSDVDYLGNPITDLSPNCDSTALALMAHSAYQSSSLELDEYFDLVNGIYADLCTFEGSSTGVFTNKGSDNSYATKEALIALSSYYYDVALQDFIYGSDDEESESTTTTTTPATTNQTDTDQTANNKNNSAKSPATGFSVTAAAAAAAALAAMAVASGVKKRK